MVFRRSAFLYFSPEQVFYDLFDTFMMKCVEVSWQLAECSWQLAAHLMTNAGDLNK